MAPGNSAANLSRIHLGSSFCLRELSHAGEPARGTAAFLSRGSLGAAYARSRSSV
jgi:hypothetical protein